MSTLYNRTAFSEGITNSGEWKTSRMPVGKEMMLTAIMCVAAVIPANEVQASTPDFNWNNISFVVDSGSLMTSDWSFRNPIDTFKKSVGEKSIKKGIKVEIADAELQRMSDAERAEFDRIGQMLCEMQRVQSVKAWFNTGVRSLEIRVEFADGLRLDMDRYYHDYEDGIETHFKLSENGETLYRDIMPMRKLVESMDIFFANL